ncbi:MAG TPA: homogentisate 1,2-dioxygenase [Microthrixaceae bacterium]|nr:homogentisate 1,2-dioxygenase [Microthrixaceae bacterium]
MPYYRRVGDLPRKRHVAHHGPDGSRRAEELMGEEGFAGASSLLYHRHSPSALVRIDCLDDAHADWERPSFAPNHPLIPHHLRTDRLEPQAAGSEPVTGRVHLLGNDGVRLAAARGSDPSPLYRNAEGDELVFVQRGAADLESVFGVLVVSGGDYVVVPRGTTHRWVPATEVELLVIESTGHVGIPPRYLTSLGQLREGAPFSERDLRGPVDEPLLVDGEDVPVLVRTRHGVSVQTHAHHPFDVVGWDGYVYPWAFRISDFEPIVGLLHQPPPVHQTFAGPGFVVCSFVPRPYDFHPHAIKVPYHHANVDSDEVLFYSDGDFMSRAGSGVGVGSITLHPAGFVHGPQPGSVEASREASATSETAVMIDTFSPLGLTTAAGSISDRRYLDSWRSPDQR